MVFERLGPSLYDFLRRNGYKPFPLAMVRAAGRLCSSAGVAAGTGGGSGGGGRGSCAATAAHGAQRAGAGRRLARQGWFGRCAGIGPSPSRAPPPTLPPPSLQARSFARQLLESVAFMHELNLVHTDLKPGGPWGAWLASTALGGPGLHGLRLAHGRWGRAEPAAAAGRVVSRGGVPAR